LTLSRQPVVTLDKFYPTSIPIGQQLQPGHLPRKALPLGELPSFQWCSDNCFSINWHSVTSQ